MGASSRRRRALLAQGGQPLPLVSSRLLCLNQAAAAMRVIEVGVMLPGARVSPRRCLSYVINLITAFFAAARAARPVALTCAAREECLELANDASKARTDRKELACTGTSLSPKKQRPRTA